MKNSQSLLQIRRATIIVALFFGLTVSAATETYRDIIEKAYNLSLQKDRSQAVAILVGAFKRENKKSAAQKELAAAIEQVSEVFYSDKAQQLFELALSLKSTDAATALSKLQEAARLEPDNLSIEMALVRQSLSNNDCDGAFSRISKQKDLYPAVEELRLVAAQAQVCLGKFDDYLALRNAQDMKHSPLLLFWQTLETEYLFKTGSIGKAHDLALAAQKTDASFPELLYWQWKTEVEMKQKPFKAAQKYLNICKTLNSRQQRQYLAEPQLCRRTADVENFLKKNNNSDL